MAPPYHSPNRRILEKRRDRRRQRAAMKILYAIGIAWVIGLTMSRCFGAPPETVDPKLIPWFNSLKQPNGIGCCSIADCRPAQAYQFTASGWRVKIEDVWYDVPNNVILYRDNPFDRPVVCVIAGRVVCLVPINLT